MKRFLVLLVFLFFSSIVLPQGDSLWQRKILPSNLTQNALFGSSVALYQNYLIVGAPGDSIYGSNSGSVYLISYSDNSISLIQKLVPNDGQSNDLFGYSVCSLSNYIIIGAPGRSEYGANSGVVYIFRYEDSVWVQHQKIFAIDPQPNDKFGQSLSGNSAWGWLLVGAPYKAYNDTSSGALFMYILNNENWNYENQLYPPFSNPNQRFGFAHDHLSNEICISAPGDNTNGTNSGAVYLYLYDDGSHEWYFISKNYSPQPHNGDEFGYSLDIDYFYRMLVGAPGVGFVGKAYLFGLGGLGFGLVDDYQPSDVDFGDKVGLSVSYFGYGSDFGRSIVGAPTGFANGNTGGAYILTSLAYGFTQNFKTIPAIGLAGDKYGYSVDNNYDYYLVGAPFNDDGGINSGAVYLNKWVHWELPVELTFFTASSNQAKVQLNWQTATELNNQGFEIQRKIENTDWITIGFRTGQGTTTEPATYFYEDDISEIISSNLLYRLKQIDFNGKFEYSEEVEVITQPLDFVLYQNHPNPFNPTTNIKYEVPEHTYVKLEIFDVLGRSVRSLVNEEKPAGRYEIEFDGSSLASGLYYCRITAGDFIQTKKMMLLK